MAEEFKISLGVELDSNVSDSIKNQLNGISKNAKIKLSIDQSSIDSQVNSIKKKIESIGNTKIKIDVPEVKSLNSGIASSVKAESDKAYRELLNLQKRISSIQLKIKGLDSDKNASQVSELNTQLERLKTTYEGLKATSKDVVSDKQFASLQREAEKAEDSLKILESKAQDIKRNFAEKISLNIDTGKLDKDISGVELSMSRLKEIPASLESEFQSLKSLSEGLYTAKSQGDIENLISLNQEYAVTLRTVQNEIRSLSNVQGSMLGNTSGFINSIKQGFQQVLPALTAGTIIYKSIDTIKKMYQEVLAVDTAMSDLYRVTDLTSSGYDALYSKMTSSAKEYASTLTDIINSTSTWAKLGYNANLSERLAEITTMYQHVADIDNSTAINNLVTSYKGFQVQLDDLFGGDTASSVQYVADIFNALSNKYAIEAGEIGDALTRSASALELAGNSIQQTAGMSTGITEITQDAAKAGSALKILSMRLRGTEASEIESLGEDTEGLIENVSALRDTIKDLSGVDIMLDDSTFKSTYQIMEEISAVYDKLSDTNQANLLETIAGKNRGSDIAALIKNWEQVKKATEDAYNAEGSAAQEHQIYIESLQGRLNALQAAWQSLSNTMLDSDFLKGLVSSGTSLLSVLDSIIDKVGVLPTLVTAFSGIASANGVGELIKQFYWLITLGNKIRPRSLKLMAT